MAEAIERSEDGVAVRLHVQPGAGRSEVVGRHSGAIKVRVAAPPERGRANDACAALLADLLGVKPGAVVLASGAASRDKRFTVVGVELAHAQRVLEGASGAAATASHPDKAAHRGRRA